MQISSFEELIAAGHQQTTPQRFLFVFLKTVLAKDHSASEAQDFEAGSGGSLSAIMSLDRRLDELTDFGSMKTEADRLSQDWDKVMVACMSGDNGRMPTPEEAEEPLKRMIAEVETGGDLSGYICFDRQGAPLQFQSRTN